MLKAISFILSALVCSAAEAQVAKRALFLGNSYTNYNNLPQLTASIAESAGDTLITAANTPGGYTFEGHLTNTTTQSLIQQGNWDFVVLQQQSQMPAFPITQVEVETFPFAAQLNESIIANNPCAETVFYMTWGREIGDQQNCATWPPVCTYEGMDDLLRERYMMMAEMNEGIVSPVGAVWRYLRENHPEIQLFASDGSHPSPAGSYVAAVCFYTSLFRKSPLNAPFDYTIDNVQETIIRQAVHDLVYMNQLEWYIGAWDPIAFGNIELGPDNSHLLINSSSNATEFFYAIDGGTYAALMTDSLTLDVAEPGEHSISIVAAKCGIADTTSIAFDIASSLPVYGKHATFDIYPNPAHEAVSISIPESFIQPQLSIYHSTGIAMLSKTVINNRKHIVDCAAWPAGVYLVSIQSSNAFVQRRLVIE